MKPRKTEHPILFSTVMVQAILALIKSMTRRMKGLEKINENPNDWNFHPGKVFDLTDNSRLCYHFYKPTIQASSIYIKCPYGQPGDKLWVRETWLYCLDDSFLEGAKSRNIYKASIHPDWYESYKEKDRFNRWTPSIHMPKSAARIWLEITNVRVERLQAITFEDAKSEGITPLAMSNTQLIQYGQLYQNYLKPANVFNDGVTSISSFYSLWCKINGEESWNANPWVWVIEFKRIEKP